MAAKEEDVDEQTMTDELAQPALEPVGGPVGPLVGAAVGAALGAVVWGLVVWITGYEVGWIAWGVGFATGGAAVLMRGHGGGLALAAAALTVAGIGGGKAIGAQLQVGSMLEEQAELQYCQETYDERCVDAEELVGLETDTDLKGFMIERNFTEATAVPDVTDEELELFRTVTVPALQDWRESPPSLEHWRASGTEAMRANFAAHFSTLDLVKESLGAMDLLFVALGVISAYKLVDSRSAPRQPLRPRRGRDEFSDAGEPPAAA